VSIVNRVMNSKGRYLLVGVLVVGFLFGALSLTYASETLLHDEAPGTVITFSGKQWIILEQMPNGETYILLEEVDRDYRSGFDYDGTNLFDSSDTNNVAYYLNNDFYNSLSQKELISEHSWDRISVRYSDRQDDANQGNVICKVGLLSYREYEKYSTCYNGNILFPHYSSAWLTRTPTDNSSKVWFISSIDGYMRETWAYNINNRAVPALYLKSNVLIEQNKVVVGRINKPNIPADLSASSQSPNAVTLTWQANTEEDLAGYRVYRGTSLVAETALTTYTDDTAQPGMTYSYSISAYNTDDQESEKSAPVTVTTPPAIPTGLSGNASGRTVSLTWQGPGNPSYLVQRSSDGTDYIQVAGVGENGIDTREAICQDLDYLGIKMDPAKNKTRGKEVDVATDDSKVRIFVIPTNEELVIARDTMRLSQK
jgi:hypothetical protein